MKNPVKGMKPLFVLMGAVVMAAPLTSGSQTPSRDDAERPIRLREAIEQTQRKH